MANSISGGIGTIKSNFGATSVPTVSDDINSGYSIGSIWININSSKAYRCFNASASAAEWEEIGAGASAGGINYIVNGDAEEGSTGFTSYDDGAVDTPVNGVDGSPTGLSIAASATSPLRGTSSFIISKNTNNAQGEGIAFAFSVDDADKASILRVSFDYEVTDTDYANGDLRCFVYDVTNSQLIELSQRNINYGKGKFISEFQTNSNSNSYRLLFHCVDSSALAWDFKLDNVQVGPREIARGSVVGDWIAYTPSVTNLGTGSSTNLGYYRRVGDSLELQLKITKDGSGGSGSSGVLVSLPSGLTIDTAKVAGTSGVQNSFGDYSAFGIKGSSTNQTGSVWFSGNSIAFANLGDVSGNALLGSNMSANCYIASNNIKVPILGWSSNAVISSDFGSRNIVARLLKSGAQSIADATSVQITFSSATDIELDTVAAFDDTNDSIVIKETGYYDVNIYGGFVANATGVREMWVEIDGVDTNTIKSIDSGFTGGGSNYRTASTTGLYLTAGKVLKMWVFQNSGGALNFNGARFNVAKRSSPQTLVGSEVVKAKYKLTASSANLSIADATLENIDYDSKIYDSHNAVTTGASWKFTAPYTGAYRLSASAYFAAGPTVESALALYKNGVIQEGFAYGAPTSYGINGSTTVDLVAGDYISAYVYADSTGASTLYTGTGVFGSAIHSFIKIEKVN